MTKPLSVDLRSRVVSAVDGGLSRRKAAERFGVSISSAIRWTAQARSTGDVRPRRVGGDKRSARIEAYAPVILVAVQKKPDVTLAELRELLAEHGLAVAVSTLWRFFARRKITLKKSPPMRRSRIVPTS
jgi:transposase